MKFPPISGILYVIHSSCGLLGLDFSQITAISQLDDGGRHDGFVATNIYRQHRSMVSVLFSSVLFLLGTTELTLAEGLHDIICRYFAHRIEEFNMILFSGSFRATV